MRALLKLHLFVGAFAAILGVQLALASKVEAAISRRSLFQEQQLIRHIWSRLINRDCVHLVHLMGSTITMLMIRNCMVTCNGSMGLRTIRRKKTFVNFADIFMGNKQKMFLIQDGGQKDGEEDSKASCTLIDSYTNPIFNNSWSKGSRYVGTAYFKNELCKKFDNVYPFFIQGEVYPGFYYESIFSGLPKGFVNEVETFWYDSDFDVQVPDDKFFTGVEAMSCASPS